MGKRNFWRDKIKTKNAKKNRNCEKRKMEESFGETKLRREKEKEE